MILLYLGWVVSFNPWAFLMAPFAHMSLFCWRLLTTEPFLVAPFMYGAYFGGAFGHPHLFDHRKLDFQCMETCFLKQTWKTFSITKQECQWSWPHIWKFWGLWKKTGNLLFQKATPKDKTIYSWLSSKVMVIKHTYSLGTQLVVSEFGIWPSQENTKRKLRYLSSLIARTAVIQRKAPTMHVSAVIIIINTN